MKLSRVCTSIKNTSGLLLTDLLLFIFSALLFISITFSSGLALSQEQQSQDYQVEESGIDERYREIEIAAPVFTLPLGSQVDLSNSLPESAQIFSQKPDLLLGLDFNKTTFKQGIKVVSAPGLSPEQVQNLNSGLPLLMSMTDLNRGTVAEPGNLRRVQTPIPVYRSSWQETPQGAADVAEAFFSASGSSSGGSKEGNGPTCQNSQSEQPESLEELDEAPQARIYNSKVARTKVQVRESKKAPGRQSRMGPSDCRKLPTNGFNPKFDFSSADQMSGRLSEIARNAGVNTCAIQNTSNWIKKNFNNRNFNNRRFVTIIDFSKPSNERRKIVIDLSTGYFQKTFAANGRTTNHRNISSFSSRAGSNSTPLGVHLTGSRYYSQKMGRCAVRLKQMQFGKSSPHNSESRGVVFHGASYCDDGVIYRTGRCGLTEGCPGVSERFFNSWAGHIAGGSIMYHFHKDLCR